MPVRKFAISVPEDVMGQVDLAAARRGLTRSGFIAAVLRRIATARTDAEVSDRVNEFFSAPELAAEQVAAARDFSRRAPPEGTEW